MIGSAGTMRARCTAPESWILWIAGLLLLEAEAFAETSPAFKIGHDSRIAYDPPTAYDFPMPFDRATVDRTTLDSGSTVDSGAFGSSPLVPSGSSVASIRSVGFRPGLDALRQASVGVADRPEPARPPGVAFLLSALVPGTGQLYNGNRRGYAYLGIEAAAWFTRMSYLDAGDRKESAFESFARRHWSYERFHETIGGDGCLGTAETDSLIQYYAQNDLDQYYEELSKTDAFRCGWDDFDPTVPDGLSPRRADYREQRQEANDLKGRANVAVAVLVINRVVSAVDAFRTARSRQSSSNLRLESRLGGSFLQPRATIGIVKEIP